MMRMTSDDRQSRTGKRGKRGKQKGLHSLRVLFSDTFSMATKFPLLAGNTLLLTALIEFFRHTDSTSVFICPGHPDRPDNVANFLRANAGVIIETSITPQGVTLSAQNIAGKKYQRLYGIIDIDQDTHRLRIKDIQDRPLSS
jgi:hypothetical protein